MEVEKDPKSSDQYWSLAFWMIIVVLICFVNYYLFRDPLHPRSIGDVFSASNALFAGLAFAGIIYTIHLQRKELILQRKELTATRREFNIQNETLKKQRFENTFFQLLGLHNQNLINLKLRVFGQDLAGKEIFKEYLRELTDALSKKLFTFESVGDPKTFQLKATPKHLNGEEYSKIIEETHSDVLGHGLEQGLVSYFRHLYHLFNFIDLSELISADEKQFYAVLVRAQLSQEELETLVYNAVTLASPRFTHLLTVYDVVKNINWASDFLSTEIKAMFRSHCDDVSKKIK